MSGWNFLSKAEGFLDRVLEDQSSNVTRSVDPSRSQTPVGRWQDRLTKAATQLSTTEGSPANSVKVEVKKSTQDGTELQESAVSTTIDAGLEAELTELQKSAIFPATMPTELPDREPHQADTLANNDLNSVPRPSSSDRQSAEIQLGLHSAKEKHTLSLAEPVSMQGNMEATQMSPESLQQLVTKLQNDIRECEARRIAELELNAERISTLESRLSYFSGEHISTSNAIARSTDASVLQKSLADKEQRIALLLEEGDLLSKKELTHLANLKKARSRITELEGLIGISLQAVENAEAASGKLKLESKETAESLRKAELRIKDLQKNEIEIADLKRDKQTLNKQITDLKRQLADADETISQSVTVFSQLQSEKSKSTSLQKQLGELLLDAKATADENSADLSKLQGQLDRAMERTSMVEQEKNDEIRKLERELENMRASLEENTAAGMESQQNKLLRQIEALQTQSAVARQNWARIEESLILRSSHAEKERDELRKQEEDLRTRIRQLYTDKKVLEEQITDNLKKVRAMQITIQDSEDASQADKKTIEALRQEVSNLRDKVQADQEVMNTTIENKVQERLNEERLQFPPASSPFSESRTPFSFQRHIPDSPTMLDRPRPGMNSRRSTQLSRAPHRKTTPYLPSAEDTVRSPPAREREEDFMLQPPRTEVSISTISAGTNIGVIERVTANARKLELELQILKEDLARVTRQRDEAREECVTLESLAEGSHELTKKYQAVQAEYDHLRSKFDATLELLGEQTEQNEQLKEDVIDLRAMLSEISKSKTT